MAAVGSTGGAVTALVVPWVHEGRGLIKFSYTSGARITPIWLLWGPLGALWRLLGEPWVHKGRREWWESAGGEREEGGGRR